MFSSGMPLLYVLMAINFTVTFWIDKWLILRFYKTPTNFNGESILYSVGLMEYGIVFHFILGWFLMSNHKILTKDEKSGEEDKDVHLESYYLHIAIIITIVNLITQFCW